MLKINVKTFQDTEYAVEADSYTYMALWKEFSKELTWEELAPGCMKQIGTIGLIKQRPVCVSFRWAKLNNHLIMFYEACSELVDWPMIEKWLSKNCPAPRCDANNFHNVYHLVK